MASLNELMAQRAALEQQIAEETKRGRAEGIGKIREIMAMYGLTAADFARVGSSKAKTPVPAKYRNQATGDTWSGRGRKPIWLEAALKGGKKLESFLIAAPSPAAAPAKKAVSKKAPAKKAAKR